MTKLNESGMAEMVAVLVVALVIGLAGGYTIGKSKSSSSTSMMKKETTSMEQTDGITVGGAKMVKLLTVSESG